MLTSIEINGTYYGSQSPETFRKWREATPEGFVFSVKGSRFCTNRKVLAEGKDSVERFVESVLPLEDRLGPILWQFAPTKKFGKMCAAFLDNLAPERRRLGPAPRGGGARRQLPFAGVPGAAKGKRVGLGGGEHFTYPEMADVTADFVYARLQKGSDDIETAYPEDQLDAWAGRLKTWAAGGQPDDLPKSEPGHTPPESPRDVFAYVIHEGKVRAPAAAKALIEKVK